MLISIPLFYCEVDSFANDRFTAHKSRYNTIVANNLYI
jgi:hypothetical protein